MTMTDNTSVSDLYLEHKDTNTGEKFIVQNFEFRTVTSKSRRQFAEFFKFDFGINRVVNYALNVLPSASKTILLNTLYFQINAYKARVESFRYYAKGWDSFNSEPPNEVAIKNALNTLDILKIHSILPVKINASSDEGIIFELLINGNYYLFEFYNDGDIVFLKRENGKSEAFDINNNEIESKILEIKHG